VLLTHGDTYSERDSLGNGMKTLTLISLLAGLVASKSLFAQSPGEDTPTGVAGGFGGTVEIGSGSFDPYELNASRSVTDVVVPGAVIPFAYTRIWNSRGMLSNNWAWDIEAHEMDENGGSNVNDHFLGYYITYPDGRKVEFKKPIQQPAAGEGAAGTYTPGLGVVDKFVIDSGQTAAHLCLADGSVVNWTESCSAQGSCSFSIASVDDPYKRRVTISADLNGTTLTEPGGRWIHIGVSQISGKTVTSTVTTSLGQSVSYSTIYDASGSYAASLGAPDPNGVAYGPNVLTTESTVTYNDVIDPATGQAVQAHYTYKTVQPQRLHPNDPQPSAFGRLVWASDPMFHGPLKQVRYIYVDNPGDNTYDP
jgi:hypothetical protein